MDNQKIADLKEYNLQYKMFLLNKVWGIFVFLKGKIYNTKCSY